MDTSTWQKTQDAIDDAAGALARCIDRAMANGVDLNSDPAVALHLAEYRAARGAL